MIVYLLLYEKYMSTRLKVNCVAFSNHAPLKYIQAKRMGYCLIKHITIHAQLVINECHGPSVNESNFVI